MNQSSSCVYVVSLGCPKNLVDTERVMADLVRSGFSITTDLDQARIVIINTCGFIRSAEQESLETIEEFCEMKRHGDIDILVVWGCLVSRRRDACRQLDPSGLVDAWLPVAEKGAVAEVIRRKTATLVVPNDPQPTHHRILATPPHTAYLRIADGCDNRCSYCTIPSIRGSFHSRPIEEIIAEAQTLADAGTVELNLIAQDSTRYGLDLYGEPRLDGLLHQLRTIEPLRWIRVLYAHPALVTEALVKTLASTPQVCRYLDIPIQHASDSILAAMKRRVTRKQPEQMVALLRREIP
ncbi:MAG TPA: radical SAM protein, partial [bacterium]|nr:radical SAM protein [bacterium]